MKSLTAKILPFSHPQEPLKWMLKVAFSPSDKSEERSLLQCNDDFSIFLPMQGQWTAKTKQPCPSWSQSRDKNQSCP